MERQREKKKEKDRSNFFSSSLFFLSFENFDTRTIFFLLREKKKRFLSSFLSLIVKSFPSSQSHFCPIFIVARRPQYYFPSRPIFQLSSACARACVRVCLLVFMCVSGVTVCLYTCVCLCSCVCVLACVFMHPYTVHVPLLQ